MWVEDDLWPIGLMLFHREVDRIGARGGTRAGATPELVVVAISLKPGEAAEYALMVIRSSGQCERVLRYY